MDPVNVSCPICLRKFDNLQALNTHLDVEHRLNDNEDSCGSNDSKLVNDNLKKTNSSGKKVQKLKRSHWEKFQKGRSRCHACGRALDNEVSAANCRKCGKLHCRRHLPNMIKLNLFAQYDPKHGKWYNCCHDCFSKKPGYNDYGGAVDLTHEYFKIRDMKKEDKNLRILQLENRFVRLVDGLITIYKKYNGSIIYNLKMNNEMSKLERTVTPWRDDRSVIFCNVCSEPFGVLLRKHHCRLCGMIVCDDAIRNCSNQISIGYLMSAASDLPFQYDAQKDSLFDVPVSIRLCSHCVSMIFLGRKFSKDVGTPLSGIFAKYESMQNISKVIDSLLPIFEDSLNNLKSETANDAKKAPDPKNLNELTRVRHKLLRSFNLYNTLTRQLVSTEPRNHTETQLQNSIKTASAAYINEKILPLKSLPAILSPEGQKTNHDEQNGEPEVKKLSQLMFENLTIKEVKELRQELMVLKEQCYLIESTIQGYKKQRRLEEIVTLNKNLDELRSRIHTVQSKLGDNGFS
ncbi:pep7p [Saccharomyces arboricola H-6]|uniref:Pep7p n=1 Tax=Saccharomyces arboricola (strain H-6 / AS 2.3317 / CBS 10644) TaxID=1160507 RepID=J8Q0V9_SACAR|nr:pep7p [Saccharomyces arboricola H-6]